ncbi:hypothetical protein PENSPDRAFT_649997 [Peniophora sp. CONT]|nr:hypothetical protein PENSPDRAFT_649997 [Peniophora sp. CONT]
MSSTDRVALIFGASGISGWATTRELLRYPSPTTFSKVIALSNRPLEPAVVQLSDPRLTYVHGVDLTQPVETVVKLLKEKVPDIGKVTNVFWYAYIHKPDDGDLVTANSQLLDTTLRALKDTSPNLQHFTWQTGGKYYGVEYAFSHPDLIPPTPFEESQPRRPEPLHSKIFYYKQLDIITEHAKDASWSWNDLRPDPIIGYAPTVNAMNQALALGAYLALYRAVHGAGATVPLPASLAAAQALNSESPADDIARASIFLSLKEDPALKGKSFNIVDSPSTYEARWPALTKAWGLVGVPPDPSVEVEGNPVAPTTRAIEWAQTQAEKWRELEEKHQLHKGVFEGIGFDFLYVMSFPKDRRMSTKALREAGWKDEPNAIAAYEEAWRLFAKVGFLPPL